MKVILKRIEKANSNTYLDTLIPKDGDIFLEVGGARGCTCENILGYSKNIKIVVVEPNPDNVASLKEAFKGSQVLIIPKGAWDKKETKAFYSIDPHRGRFRSYQGSETRIEVEVDTLDSLLEQYKIDRVDLIKIDTEGSEYQILKGLTKYRKGAKFHIECHNNLYEVLSLLLEKKAVINKIILFSDYEGENLAQILGEF